MVDLPDNDNLVSLKINLIYDMLFLVIVRIYSKKKIELTPAVYVNSL